MGERLPGKAWGPLLVSLMTLGAPAELAGQAVCPGTADPLAAAAWASYRAGAVDDAGEGFDNALAACPDHLSAMVGAGYVALRQDRLDTALQRFEAAADRAPANVDAVIGIGLVAWRRGDLDGVHAAFSRVTELEPTNETALDYLGRLPEGLGPPPERPPLVLPDTVEVVARAPPAGFEVNQADVWTPLWMKGVNLGAALPGRHASEFPDSSTYAGWVTSMVEMGTNVVRLYTIHPPALYEAILQHNTDHPDRPLRIVHGVWTELPDDHDFAAPDFEDGFFSEMRRVVDLIHGRADIRPRPGNASGHYTADVSPWTAAYIIGREWEPFSVLAFDSLRAGLEWDGRYVRVEGGNAMDAWLGRAIEHMVAYETETYRHQRPVAYTNWPTLDPLDHPTETTVAEEVAMREARGEVVERVPLEYDNDGIDVDPSRIKPTPLFTAGTFASYHAYPYYPDFMVLDEGYARANSSFGPSGYFGYLSDLLRHHDDMPVLIAEYGVPASIGNAHLQPQGWHHGGLTEVQMAEANRRMTLEIAEAGGAGAIVFAWIDEWFKRNWLTIEFEIPLDRNRLWYNRLDAEQHYGMIAMEALPAIPGESMEQRASGWRERGATVESDGLIVRAAHDEAYLWLRVEAPDRGPADVLYVGFDLLDPARGDRLWPGGVGPRSPVGLEMVLVDDGAEVRLLADPSMNPFAIVPVADGSEDARRREIGAPPRGAFQGAFEQRFNRPWRTVDHADGRYDSLRVLVNRRRLGRDGTEFMGAGYDRGILPPGPAPDGLWERDGVSVLEVRIPWGLLDVTDPSSRTLLQSAATDSGGFGTTQIPDVGLVVGLAGPGGAWRGARTGDDVGRYAWPVWEEPEWTARRRPAWAAMRDAFAGVDAVAITPARPEPSETESPSPEPTSSPRPDAPPAPEGMDADAAWQAGLTEQAVTLYEARLAERPDDPIALHRVALARAWAEDYDGALALFDRLLVIEPENLDARVDRARVHAWSGDGRRAIAALDSILIATPTNRAALAGRAQFAAWEGSYDEALGSYDELLRITPGDDTARRGRAQVLVWSDRFREATAVYDSLLADDPDDLETRLARARVLAFADRSAEAIAAYGELTRIHPADPRVWQGLARSLSWGGRLIEAERTYHMGLERAPANGDLLAGLAQTLRWQGRAAAALEVLDRAETLAPEHEGVAEQRRWVDADLAPDSRVSLVAERDSDDNDMITTLVAASAHPHPRIGLTALGYSRNLSTPFLDRRARGGTVTIDGTLEPGWRISGTLGVSASDVDGAEAIDTWGLSLRTPGRHRAGASVGVNRTALDATAGLAQTGVSVTLLDVSGRTSRGRWTLTGGASTARYTGTSDNRRLAGHASLGRRLSRAWTVGLSLRSFGFESDLSDGYFDPDLYAIGETTLRWSREISDWSWSVEAAPGLQKIGADGGVSGTLRSSVRLTRAFGPGRSVFAGGGYSRAGLRAFAADGAGYRYSAILLGMNWNFSR